MLLLNMCNMLEIIRTCSLPGMDLLLSFSVPGGGEEGGRKIAGWIRGLTGLLRGSIPRLKLS